jgi:S1-C subfamily serine protease
MVVHVEAGSPAQSAGLREGDVIVALNESPVRDVDDLHRALTETMIGVPTTITVLRRSQRLAIEVTPAESAPRQ